MKSRSKTNNFVAILIAVILFAIGFGLYFAHQQTKSNQQLGQIQSPVTSTSGAFHQADNHFILAG